MLDGSPRVSLVAFGFRHTRVRGLTIPGHVTFPEINLRFYVRLGGERAVVFIREFVPRPAISIVARLVYNEPYRTIAMQHETIATAGRAARAPPLRPRASELARGARGPGRPPARSPARPSTGSRTTTSASAARAAAPRAATASSTTCGRCTTSATCASRSTSARCTARRWAHLADAEPSHVTLAAGSRGARADARHPELSGPSATGCRNTRDAGAAGKDAGSKVWLCHIEIRGRRQALIGARGFRCTVMRLAPSISLMRRRALLSVAACAVVARRRRDGRRPPPPPGAALPDPAGLQRVQPARRPPAGRRQLGDADRLDRPRRDREGGLRLGHLRRAGRSGSRTRSSAAAQKRVPVSFEYADESDRGRVPAAGQRRRSRAARTPTATAT